MKDNERTQTGPTGDPDVDQLLAAAFAEAERTEADFPNAEVLMGGFADPPAPKLRMATPRRRPRLLLARLAGADPQLLEQAATEQTRYTTMGGVLLTTATFAALSAFLALDTVTTIPTAISLVAGLLWGLAICNVDRLLVVTMNRDNGVLRNLLAALPRLALAFVLGAVISVPLLVRFFEPEIDRELTVMAASSLASSQALMASRYDDITKNQLRIDELQEMISGSGTSKDPDVVAAQEKVDSAKAAYIKATNNAECELDGTCGANTPGVGERYLYLRAQADLALDQLSSAQLNFESAQERAKYTVDSTRSGARDEITRLQDSVQARSAERDAEIRIATEAQYHSDGFLSRLEALGRLSSERDSVGLAIVSITLLMLILELLPVIAKLIALSGSVTLYEQVHQERETELLKTARAQEKAAISISEHRAELAVTRTMQMDDLMAKEELKLVQAVLDDWLRSPTPQSFDDLLNLMEQARGHRRIHSQTG